MATLEEIVALHTEQIDAINSRLASIDKNMARIADFFEKVDIGGGVIKWFWNNLARLGTVILAIIIVLGVFQLGVGGALKSFFKLVNGN